MTKKGVVGPIGVSRTGAVRLSSWVVAFPEQAFPPDDAHVIRPEVFEPLLESLAAFLIKIFKGGKRNRRSPGDRVNLFNVTKGEALAGFWYLSWRFCSPISEAFPPPPDVMEAAVELMAALLSEALPAQGRPARSYATTRDLLEAYRTESNSALRNEKIGGLAVKAAKNFIAEVDALMLKTPKAQFSEEQTGWIIRQIRRVPPFMP